jgi:predicted transcriptional regulator
MTVLNVKQQAQSLIEKLPDNCTWDDIMQQVYVILAVEAGLADSQAGRVKSVEEVRSQFGLQA